MATAVASSTKTKVEAPAGHGFQSAAEMREVLDRTLTAVNGDQRVGPLLQASGVRLRIECPDVHGVLQVFASRDSDSYLEWRFDRRGAGKPRLVLTMNSDVANEWLQGRLSVPIAIAHGRMKSAGEARWALLYLPAVKLISGAYTRVVDSGYPHLAL
jgi:hypothetical protein